MESNILVKAKNEDLENIEFIKQYFLDFQGVELQNATTIKRALKELRIRMEKEYEEDKKWHMSNKYDCNNLYIYIEYKDEFLIGYVLEARNKVPVVFYIIEELISRIKTCRYKNEYINSIRKYMDILNAYEVETLEEFEEIDEDEYDQGFTIGKITIDINKKTFQYVNSDTYYQKEDLVDMFGDFYDDNFIELNYDLSNVFDFDKIDNIINDTKFIKVGYKYDNHYYGVI